jgi:hypothetical protein
VSEFPYFKDVPIKHWAYIPIEGFRTRDMLVLPDNGYFKPDEPIDRLEAGVILGKTLTSGSLKLTPQEVEDTFKAYHQPLASVPDADRYDLARSIYGGFLMPVSHIVPLNASPHAFVLDLSAPLSRMDAARMVYRRARLEHEELLGEERMTWLPAGVQMVLTPTTALSSDQMSVGKTLFFSLVETVKVPSISAELLRGTRVHGRVTEISADKQQVVVSLNRANLPSGEFYDLATEMTISFQPNKNQQGVIVPGNQFTVTTTEPNH